MEPHLAIAEHADRLAALDDVADQHERCVPLPTRIAAVRRLAPHMHLAETGCRAQLVLFGELLVTDAEHDIAVEGCADRRDGGLIERPAQIDPGDFGPERRWERRD